MPGFNTAEIRVRAKEVAGEEAEMIAREWFSAANKALIDGGDEYGYETFGVAQSGMPPERDGDDWVFGFSHHAAQFLNDGTEPHVIRAKEADFLAFEWPDAPAEVQEMFEATFPLVFFKEIDHPGTEALRYMERSRDEVAGG